MENLKKHLIIGVSVLSASILLSGIFIGCSIKPIKQSSREVSSASNSYEEVLSITQISQYLNMSEDEVKGIISTEKYILEKTGSFSGMMFPYIKVNNKYYFYKESINGWLKENSNNRREYDTVKGYVF